MDENRIGCVCEEPPLESGSADEPVSDLLGCLIWIVVLLILVGWAGYSFCHPKEGGESLGEVGQILAGDHRLARISDDPEDPSPYFVFFKVERESESGKLTTLKVNFCWERVDSYSNSSLYLNQVRVKLDPQASEPSVKFYWRRPDLASVISDDDHQRWVVENYVIYALVTIRPEDWRVKVKNLPRDLPVDPDRPG